jgi:hypothetical protein
MRDHRRASNLRQQFSPRRLFRLHQLARPPVNSSPTRLVFLPQSGSSVPRAQLVRVPPSGRAGSRWRVGTSRLLTMPYGLEVLGLLKGRLASTELLPQSGNQLGDTWVVGHTPWVWITLPGWSQPMWVDP